MNLKQSPFFLLGLLLVFAPRPVSSAEAGEAVFLEIQRTAQARIPVQIRGRLASPLIDAQLATVPRDKVVYRTQPWAEFLFLRNSGLRIVVRNVDDYYVRLFAVFEPILDQSGLFLGVDRRNAWSAVKRNYEFKGDSADASGLRKVRVRERDGLPGDEAVLTYGPEGLLQESEYFEEGKRKALLRVEWIASGELRHPGSVELSWDDAGRKRELRAKLVDVRFEGVSASEFRGR